MLGVFNNHMRTPALALSILLHLALLAGLLFHAAPPQPTPRTAPPPETQATLLTEAMQVKPANTSTTSNTSAAETTRQTVTETMPENQPHTALSEASAVPEHPSHDASQTHAKPPSSPPNGAPANPHSNLNNNSNNNSSNISSATSTSTTTATATQGERTALPALAKTSTPRNTSDDNAPVRNRPQTKQMTCTASAKRQGIIGQVMAHVEISANGIVQSARISGSTQDATMKQLAHEQAMHLKFPMVQNAAGTTVASYADVKLTFDCGSD